MDIPRKVDPRKKWLRRIAYAILVCAILGGVTAAVYRLKPAAPTVDRASTWLDTVRRGPMVREVRGVGTLVPEQLLWVPAATNGRVERIPMRPGAPVGRDTVIVVLTDTALQLAAVEAEYQVKAAEARYRDLEVQLKSQHLNQEAEVAKVEADYQQAKLRADRNEILAKEGLLADIDLRVTRSNADLLENRQRIENERLKIQSESTAAQLAVQRAEVERLRALAQLRRNEVEALNVRAGTEGVLQELPVQVGQHVAPGTILAKVAQPTHLMAELKVPETQAKDVAIGQAVLVDTRNGVIEGRVTRVDPTVKEGTVTIDVRFDGALPAGVRPDMNVDGVIEIERLADAVFVGRPAFAQANSTVSIFRLEKDGKTAVRTQVAFGRTSVSIIEVLRGLQVGDTAILSDMSTWESHDRVVLR